MGKYKKCPRCELNYILAEEEMCEVCKSELGMESDIILVDDIIDEDEPVKLCPVCKAAYINLDEPMCEACLANEKQTEEPDDDNDEWRTYLDDDDTPAEDEDAMISLDELEEEEAEDEEEFEDEENPDLSDDDFETIGDIDQIEDIDDDDEEADDDDF